MNEDNKNGNLFLKKKKLRSKKNNNKNEQHLENNINEINNFNDISSNFEIVNFKDMNHININYEIDNFSSYITTFHPKNILLDTKISGQVSKWSVDFKSQNEYLYLKLEKTSIIYLITFGKFKDPTNLKEFKIYAGMNKTEMIEILHSGLTYEDGYEPFVVNYKLEGVIIPCNYLKIVPIRPWDDNYNISIWFINLKGIDDPLLVDNHVKIFTEKMQMDSMRNWLNLSRLNFKNKCLDLLKVKGFEKIIKKIESPIITELYECVMNGNFERSSEILNILSSQGYFKNYLDNIPYKIKWKQMDYIDREIGNFINRFNNSVKIEEEKNKKQEKEILNEKNNSNIQNREVLEIENEEENLSDFDINSEMSGFSLFPDGMESPSSEIFMDNPEEKLNTTCPSGRGGHNMVLDDENQIIYLFGGWDGTEDLNDFWFYDIKKENWKLISTNTSSEGGPSKRSCHKMVYDPANSRILLYGKYGKSNEIPFDNFLFEFDTKIFKWKKYIISKELRDGSIIESIGPGQVYDHQLVIDSISQILYIFGGSKIPETEEKYLGLWKLDLKEFYWENLLPEQSKDPYNIKLKSRCGHSMVLGLKNELIIYGGNKGPRKANGLFDVIIFNTKTNSLRELFHDYSKKNGPFVNFSTCSYFNHDKNELYIFGGCLISEKMDTLTNNFWVLNLDNEKWTKCEIKNSINYDKLNILNNFYKDIINLNYENDCNCISNTNQGQGSSNLSYEKNLLYCSNDTLNEPLPRYAHCMVFSKHLSRGFVFGGNPNLKNTSRKSERLNDFWSFEISKTPQDIIVNKLIVKIYKLYFKELCEVGKIEKAVDILQNKIIPFIENKENKINKFTKILLQVESNQKNEEDIYKMRFSLYEKISNIISKDNIANKEILNR